MRSFFCYALSLVLCFPIFAQDQTWKVKSGKITFKSETELESIWGKGEAVSGQFNPISKKIHIEIELDGIKTDNKLQTSHLHENYFETNLYPIASFDGIVSETKETGEVEAIGTLELHGVRQEQVKLTGKVEKTKDGVEQISYFSIKLSDYKIQVPKLLFLKINPIIQVKINLIWETPK